MNQTVSNLKKRYM